MQNDSHDLHADFPEFAEKIHQLKMHNAHFKRLFEEYNQVNNAVLRAEAQVDTPSDDALMALKGQRVNLKDQIYAMLQA